MCVHFSARQTNRRNRNCERVILPDSFHQKHCSFHSEKEERERGVCARKKETIVYAVALKPRTLLFTEMQIHGLKTKPFLNAYALAHIYFASTRRYFRRLTTYRGSLVVQFYKIIVRARVRIFSFLLFLSFSLFLSLFRLRSLHFRYL